MKTSSFVLSCALAFAACAGQTPAPAEPVPSETPAGDTSSSVNHGSIDAALAGDHRSEANRARDVYRHPKETLAFFGVEPGKRVVELWPGRGWYTEILAPLLHDEGALVAVAPDNKYLVGFREVVAARPDVFGRVELMVVNPPDSLSMGEDGSADVVLTFRNVHNWLGSGYADAVMQAAFKVLKPGGVLGVVEHRGKPGLSAEQIKTSGYMPEDMVIALATKAGFVLDERSEINANPKDTTEYEKGVWTLPPALALGDQDRDKYLAIGESDRMTLRFKKPE